MYVVCCVVVVAVYVVVVVLVCFGGFKFKFSWRIQVVEKELDERKRVASEVKLRIEEMKERYVVG